MGSKAMALTKGRINRTGIIKFHDAKLMVWEEGIVEARNAGGWAGAAAWERQFKRDVFARIVQTLNRIGWSVMPWNNADEYKDIALSHRSCSKGDLQAELSVSGRCIELEMWQDIQNGENPNGGKYDFDKEGRMTYLQRLEMERTRSRIRDYLCNVFTGYTFEPPKLNSPNPDPLAYFNSTWNGEYEKHRGVDRFERGADGWPSDKALSSWSRTDLDGLKLNHGDTRWLRDSKGRLLRGRVYGGINDMWIFVYGPGQRDFTYSHSRSFFTYTPSLPRKHVEPCVREKKLKAELQTAIAHMAFERAVVLRDILKIDAQEALA